MKNQAEEVQAICTECQRHYDGRPCPSKEDDDPCENFVPRYFKDTGSYMYKDNKWFKLAMDEDKTELHPVRLTNKQVGWIEYLIRREFSRVDISEHFAGVCRSILSRIEKSVRKSKKALTEGKTLSNIKGQPTISIEHPSMPPASKKDSAKECLKIFEQLVKIKNKAVAELKKIIRGVHIDMADINMAEITEIYVSPAKNVKDLEELETFLRINLLFTIDNINNKHITKLLETGNVTLLDHNAAFDEWRITYSTSYAFEYDEGKVETSFTNPD